MKSNLSNWLIQPSKKQLIIIIGLYLSSLTLVFIGNDNSIPFIFLFLVVLPATLVVLRVISNYSKTNKKNDGI
jgi:hypothetical protein